MAASLKTLTLVALLARQAHGAAIETNPVTLVEDVVPLNHDHPAFGAAVADEITSYEVRMAKDEEPVVVVGANLTSEVRRRTLQARELEVTSKDIQRLEDHFGAKMVTNFKTLSSDSYRKASVAQAPWPSSYWAMYLDGINYRWNPADKSPAEKYALAFGLNVKTFTDKVSQTNGILSQKNRRQCKQTSECASLNDGSFCGIRDGETTGRCIPGWFGICHAWAPAAFLEKEPLCPVTRGNVTFNVFDIKALVTQVYDGASIATVFTGARFNGPDDPPAMDSYGRYTDAARRDLGPGFFHIAISNIMGKFKQSFVVDVDAGAQVWNQPVRNYEVVEMKEVDIATTSKQYFGTEKYPFNPDLKSLAYVKTNFYWIVESGDDGPLVSTGKVDAFTQSGVYEYLLELDADKNIIGGEWVGQTRYEHPDFLWFPKAKPSINSVTSVGLKYKDVEQLIEDSVKCAPTTPAPTTPAPTTPAPTTPVPTTPAPTTPVPTTPAPTTPVPTTPAPTTPAPTTPVPTTPAPTTPVPTTPAPTTPVPTTPAPTTPAPTTPVPTTPAPTTPAPTTPAPTTPAPTTPAPTTPAPTTPAPTTPAPTTPAPTTPAPTTPAPTTPVPTTPAPTTVVPGVTTPAPTTPSPTTPAPTTPVPTTTAPVATTPAPTTPQPTTTTPSTTTPAPSTPTPSATVPSSTTPAPTTVAPSTTTPAPTTAVPVTTTPAPTTVAPTTTTPAPTTATPATTTSAPSATTPAPTTATPVTTAPAPTTVQPPATVSPPGTSAPTTAPTTAPPASSQCGTAQVGIDLYGEDLKQVYWVTHSGCCDACAKTSGCKAYTYIAKDYWGGASCYLKKGKGKSKANSGAISGVIPTKDEPVSPGQVVPMPDQAKCTASQHNVDFYGSDLKQVYRVSQSQCCTECAKTSGCKAYTYIAKDYWGGSSCYLKSSTGKKRHHSGAVSAVLTTEADEWQQW